MLMSCKSLTHIHLKAFLGSCSPRSIPRSASDSSGPSAPSSNELGSETATGEVTHGHLGWAVCATSGRSRTAASCGTPRPSAYIAPRLYCARAWPRAPHRIGKLKEFALWHDLVWPHCAASLNCPQWRGRPGAGGGSGTAGGLRLSTPAGATAASSTDHAGGGVARAAEVRGELVDAG